LTAVPLTPASTYSDRQQSLRWRVFWLRHAIPLPAGIINLLIWYSPDAIARHDVGNTAAAA
jgi:hypothetical protein